MTTPHVRPLTDLTHPSVTPDVELIEDAPVLTAYVVTLSTPKGVFDVELNSTRGPDAAARRAWLGLVQARYGDVDEVTVITIREA